MSTTTILAICENCVVFHANGDVPDDPATAAAVTAYPGHLVVDCGEDLAGCEAFSWQACEACGSGLGGARHRAFAW